MLSFTASAQEASLDHWLNRATRIAVVAITQGRILDSAPRACAFAYSGRVERDVRNGASFVEFMADEQLIVGGKYLLVVAEQASWAKREFATDVPPSSSETSQPAMCRERFGKALIVRGAEIRPIDDDLYPQKTWVRFAPNTFPPSHSLTRVSDLDRIELAAHNIEWPTVGLHDYYLLDELLALVR
jgi:hypothetical protein